MSGDVANRLLNEDVLVPVLIAVGAWDPFNVTEDADLGIRLARRGYGTTVLASTTWEEAPAHFIPWLKQRDVALLGWETPGYMPQPPGDLPRIALHDFALAILGIHLLDRADFDALSETAAAQNRWEFMLTVAPLPVRGATGSPVNPIATF